VVIFCTTDLAVDRMSGDQLLESSPDRDCSVLESFPFYFDSEDGKT
jgi:hypothetical protein